MNGFDEKFNAVVTFAPLLPRSLHSDAPTFRVLLEQQGPSLGLWRAAEVAVLREQTYQKRLANGLHCRSHTLAVQMHGSGVYSNPFTLMLGARTTAGFVREGDQQDTSTRSLCTFDTDGYRVRRNKSSCVGNARS